jgi:plastocyanin
MSGAPSQETTAVPVHRRVRVSTAALLVLAFAMLVAGCQSSRGDEAAKAPPASGVREVTARDLVFIPRAIQVPVGTTVTWHFQDGRVPHNVQGDGFKSANVTEGTYQHRFDRPGNYTYVCTVHAGMTGRVEVVGG